MEGCLELVTFFDADIVATPSDIQFGEPTSILEVVDELRNEGERVLVQDDDLVQFSIILYRSE